VDPYRVALLDWLACAIGGLPQGAALAAAGAADGLASRVAALGTAGHVLDFDDTYPAGLAHLSAPVAPAALVVGADLGATVGDVLAAYAAGFEAMGALSAANHPAIRERGWHPTAVCGGVGAAVACAQLLGADREQAVRLALLQAGGLQAAFGSDGKALQVGMAAAAGATAARLAAGGATVSEDVVAGFEQAYGARFTLEGDGAGEGNWIKAYPCCLQTHSSIEAAAQLREDGGGVPRGALTVAVHPVSRLTAFRDDVADGLQAKFSIPYLVAFTLLRGAPGVESFARVDPEARALAAERIRVRTDPALLESEAQLEADGTPIARVETALGSPGRPMDASALAAKVDDLAGARLDGVLDDSATPARDVLAACQPAMCSRARAASGARPIAP
jgi:2-methylcitrate dehydratase PrpD